MGVDWSSLMEVFQEWAREIYPNTEELDWLAIDGKSLRSTLTNSQNQSQNFVMIVSLFSQKTGLVIDLRRIENKQGSEISAAQDIVRCYRQEKKVFTSDALHCNQQFTQAVIQGNNDYLIPVKKNNSKLYQKIEEVTKKQKPLSVEQQYEQSHGREIIRQVSVFENKNIEHKSCKNLKSIIQVDRIGFRGITYYKQTVYYLSSVSKSAKIMAERIRGHWGIENRLHWGGAGAEPVSAH